MKRNRICFFCLLVLSFWSCAIQVPPGGGIKDTEPPHLISSEPANYSNLFNRQNIQLNFDEYISLNDIGSQLIVSPLLKYPPETKIRKKSLLIHILDTLLENTTYTMNFGLGITDNNEGNKLENFQYVFSTGTIIDTLDIRGKIETAFDNKTEKGVLALLYRSTTDSLPYLERPLYFSRTNDSGQFRISNIAPGSYKLIGLKEKNGDYVYLQGEELIGFTDSLIKANRENVNLKIFRETPSLRFLRAYSEFPGKAVVVFNGPADTIKWNWLTDTTKLDLYSLNFSKNHDTINIWYKNIFADSLSFNFDTISLNDTITIRLFKNTDANKGRKKISMTIIPGNLQTTLQHLHLPSYLQSNHPIKRADFKKITLLEDSLPVKPKFNFTDSLHMQFNVEYIWKSKSKYSLFIPPAAFTDIFGMTNDTVQLSFSTHGESDYGSVKINFRKSDPFPYVIQLVNVAGNIVYREILCSHDTILDLTYLDPRVYKVKLIHDRNGNGRWDTGNYLYHIQPEEIEFYPEEITVRANWDVDVNIKVPLSAEIIKK